MPTYLAFLRAINLGANRKFPKDAIKAATEGAGFTDVATHINTGNVRLSTSMRSRTRIEVALEAAFREDRAFEVPTIVFNQAEFANVGRDVAELASSHPDLERHYVLLCKVEPDLDLAADIEALGNDLCQVVVRGRAVHLLIGPGYEQGQVDPLRVEKRLGVVTSRNATVIMALVEKWC